MRWSPVVLTVLAASLAAAAGLPDGSRKLQEVVPTTPWSAPVAVAPVAGPVPSLTVLEWGPRPAPVTTFPSHVPAGAGASAAPASPSAPDTSKQPDVVVPESLWYEQPKPAPQHLYLERLLMGETVDGWGWDAGVDAEALSAEVNQLSEPPGLSLGFEHRTERTVFKNKEGEYEDASLVGPRMRWRPTEHTHFDLSPLVGVNTPYPMSEVVLVFGWVY
jgi:hypothetical protein